MCYRASFSHDEEELTEGGHLKNAVGEEKPWRAEARSTAKEALAPAAEHMA
jgi:hypothetical protein